MNKNALKTLNEFTKPSALVTQDFEVISPHLCASVAIIERGSILRYDGWHWLVFRYNRFTNVTLTTQHVAENEKFIKYLPFNTFTQ